MRGRVPARRAGCRTKGITPAYAGKRRTTRTSGARYRDHPRVCGEEPTGCYNCGSLPGSPPRMRGRAEAKEADRLAARITPAYAGKSMQALASRSTPQDHPRVCGEEIITGLDLGGDDGSPPRMRGRAEQSMARNRVSTDHPRVCGEECRWRVLQLRMGRITPAYAGKRLKKFHSIGHFSCILCLFHSVLHRASASGGSRAGPCAPPCLPAQNAIPV